MAVERIRATSIPRVLISTVRGDPRPRAALTNDTEGAGEDDIEEAIGVRRERCHATDGRGCNEGVRALAVDDEGGRRAVEVAAAVELFPLGSSLFPCSAGRIHTSCWSRLCVVLV